MGNRCCGTELQVILLSDDAPDRPGVSLHRCAGCGSRGYLRAGTLLSPDEAFAALAGLFQRQESPTRAERDRALASDTARRAAQIAAERAERADQRAQARAERESAATAAPAAVDVTDLADLLSSWTVLGATR